MVDFSAEGNKPKLPLPSRGARPPTLDASPSSTSAWLDGCLSPEDKSPDSGRRSHVSFATPSNNSVHVITPYSKVYGIHPRLFEFDKKGKVWAAKNPFQQPESFPATTGVQRLWDQFALAYDVLLEGIWSTNSQCLHGLR